MPWIRSQDSQVLVELKAISFQKEDSSHRKNIVHGWVDGELYFVLGEYQTPERALQVIDEIQNILTNASSYETHQTSSASGWLTTEHNEVVYQMPKE